MNPFFKIHPADNVAVALYDTDAGSSFELDGQTITLIDNIKQAQKVALQSIQQNENVIKYGSAIGHMLQTVNTGCLVDHHNLATNLNDLEQYQYQPDFQHLPLRGNDRQVNIYRRANGQIGIRNELWIIPTVGCVNGIIKMMKNQFEQLELDGSIDGIHVFNHQFGCSQLGHDHQMTKTMLQRLALHPNAGGVLIVGLGCENNQLEAFKETLGNYNASRVKFMNCQDHEDELEFGLSLLQQLYAQMKTDQREPGLLSEVKFGLECGGSDGFSGITANPLLGRFSDYVISHGGTSVLTEVPEMFGAETILMNRCNDHEVFLKTVAMINNFKQAFIDNKQPIYENPSPGNKAGGISTLEEKSLGCTQKAGNSNVIDVLDYGDVLQKPGLNLLTAPGNDAIATTALSISGCHMVLFSTGRGTPYGGPVPTVKIATNSELATRKKNWIDFNAGELVENTSMDTLLEQFIDTVVAAVNGKLVCNEVNDFREIAVYKSGVTL